MLGMTHYCNLEKNMYFWKERHLLYVEIYLILFARVGYK